mgnify:CR=1 FL=1
MPAILAVSSTSLTEVAWSYFNKFTDNGKDYLPYIEGKTNTPMPLFVKPKHKLSVQDVKDMMQLHVEYMDV